MKFCIRVAYLMPCPNRLKAVQERDILPQVGEQPQSRWSYEVRGAEEYDPKDGHEEKETEQDEEAPAQVVYTLAHLERPEGVEDDCEDDEQSESGVHLALDLAALPEPDIVHLLLRLLLRLDADGPKPLDALCLLGPMAVALMAFIGVGLGDAQGKHGHREKFERILE
jgi:hypothetical protein